MTAAYQNLPEPSFSRSLPVEDRNNNPKYTRLKPNPAVNKPIATSLKASKNVRAHQAKTNIPERTRKISLPARMASDEVLQPFNGYRPISIASSRVNSTNIFPNMGIFSGLLLYLLIGITETVFSSFYSVEAINRGLSSIHAGLVFAAFEGSNFVCSFFLMYNITSETQKFFCVAGSFVMCVTVTLFGLLQWVEDGLLFTALSIAIEVVAGSGAAMSLSTAIPLMVTSNLKHAGKITAWAETLVSAGCLLGPPIGSVLYTAGGYCLPFFLSGVLLLSVGVLLLIFLPSHTDLFSSESGSGSSTPPEEVSAEIEVDAQRKFEPLAYFRFVTHPNLLLVSLVGIAVSAQMAFFDVCLSLYLTDDFGASSNTIGLLFLALGLSNVAASPVVGVLVDRGLAVHVIVLTSFGYSGSLFLLCLPHQFVMLRNIPYITCVFLLAGAFTAGAFVPTYLFFERLAQKNGFDNPSQTRVLVATWANNLYSIGSLFGALLLSGPIFDIYGFYVTCFVMSIVMMVFSLICFFYVQLKGFCKHIYYEDEFEYPEVTLGGQDSSQRSPAQGSSQGSPSHDSGHGSLSHDPKRRPPRLVERSEEDVPLLT